MKKTVRLSVPILLLVLPLSALASQDHGLSQSVEALRMFRMTTRAVEFTLNDEREGTIAHIPGRLSSDDSGMGISVRSSSDTHSVTEPDPSIIDDNDDAMLLLFGYSDREKFTQPKEEQNALLSSSKRVSRSSTKKE